MEQFLADHREGRLEPLPVTLPNTEGLPDGVMRVARFAELLFGLRAAANFKPGEPVPIGCDWVAKKVNPPLSGTGAWKALRALEARGAIKKMKPLRWQDRGGKKNNPIDTYLPGDGGGS